MGDAVQIGLLGGLEVNYGPNQVQLPLGAQRLLALLGLQDGGMHRSTAAERLWPNSPRARAPANLRTALWKASRIRDTTVIESIGPRLRLAKSIQVDMHVVLNQARHLTEDGPTDTDSSRLEKIITVLSYELLPDWSDEWLLLERERWDQVRMHTLETLSGHLMSIEDYLPALAAAFAAVAIEPVRESAHRAVIEIYIAEGNTACALKHYQRYRGLVQRELGVMPSRRMNELIHPLTTV